jgi:hypothetical protein
MLDTQNFFFDLRAHLTQSTATKRPWQRSVTHHTKGVTPIIPWDINSVPHPVPWTDFDYILHGSFHKHLKSDIKIFNYNLCRLISYGCQREIQTERPRQVERHVLDYTNLLI